MSYLNLFLMFFKVGLFTIGGGYAMIPVIQEEVVDKRNLLTTEEFVDALAVSQASPGAMAVNISIFLGYRMKGFAGAIVATLGSTLPSFMVIMAVSTLFFKYREFQSADKIFTGIRAAVVAAIGYSLVKLMKTVKMKKFGYVIFVTASFLLVFLSWNPILVLILGALSYILFEKATSERRDNNDRVD